MALENGTPGAGMNPEGQQSNSAGQTANNDSKTSVAASNEKIVLTTEELEKKLQSEADKRVTEALKTAQTKWEQDYNKKIETERKEAEKLAKLSEEERSRVLEEKRSRELEERERTIYKKELELAAVKILDGKKLPVQFARMFLGDNAEDTHTNIENFEKSWHSEIEARVNERLKGFTPPNASGSDKKLVTMNDIIRGQARRGR